MNESLEELAILQANLRKLNTQLEVLDNKLSNLEIISGHSFYEIYLLASRMDILLPESRLAI
jgi:hypothetical protein